MTVLLIALSVVALWGADTTSRTSSRSSPPAVRGGTIGTVSQTVRTATPPSITITRSVPLSGRQLIRNLWRTNITTAMSQLVVQASQEDDPDNAMPSIIKTSGKNEVVLYTNINANGIFPQWKTLGQWKHNFSSDHDVYTRTIYKEWRNGSKTWWAAKLIETRDLYRVDLTSDVLLGTNGTDVVYSPDPYTGQLYAVTNQVSCFISDVEFPGNQGSLTIEKRTYGSHTKTTYSASCRFMAINTSTNYFRVYFNYAPHSSQYANACLFFDKLDLGPGSTKSFTPGVKSPTGCPHSVTYGILIGVEPMGVTKEEFDGGEL